MRLKTLLEQFTNDDIVHNLIDLYPKEKKNIKGYFDALKELKSLKPIKSKIYIDFDIVKDEDGNYVDVAGISNSERMSIVYTDWKEWLGMRISSTTEKIWSHLNICSHCLWEMTFCGYSNKEVQSDAKELVGLTEEIKCIK